MRHRIICYNIAGQMMPIDGLGELKKDDMLFRDIISRENGIGMVLRTPIPFDESVRITVRLQGGAYEPSDVMNYPITPPASPPSTHDRRGA